MANLKISQLDALLTVDGTEAIPIAKSGLNYQLTVSQIVSFIGIATTLNAGLLSASDKTKLDSVAAGATANSTDAQLRDRSTHTGTQAASTITGLALVATSGSYNDLSYKPDLSLTGLGAAPATHVGAGGSTAHPDVTSTTSGFMNPTMLGNLNTAYNTLSTLSKVAQTGLYTDLSGLPAIPTQLSGMSDITFVGTKTTGQLLQFNGTVWGNVTFGMGSLADVNTAGIANGQGLAWDSTTSKWVPATFGTGTGGSTTLAGLSDVSLTSQTQGQALTWDNTAAKWVNTTITATTALSALTDVALTSQTNGQVLSWNSTASKWENSTISQTVNSTTNQNINFVDTAINPGFTWVATSLSPNGNSNEKYSSFGTTAYVATVNTGTDFKSKHGTNSFTSSAATYSSAGIGSSDPIVRRDAGFVFEGIFCLPALVTGSGAFFGLDATNSQAYGNFTATNVGIGIGWGSSNVGTDHLQLYSSDGTTLNTLAATTGSTLSAAMNIYIRMWAFAADTTKVYVTVKDLDTGTVIWNQQQMTLNLPPATTPLYAVAQMGTLGQATSVSFNLGALTARPESTLDPLLTSFTIGTLSAGMINSSQRIVQGVTDDGTTGGQFSSLRVTGGLSTPGASFSASAPAGSLVQDASGSLTTTGVFKTSGSLNSGIFSQFTNTSTGVSASVGFQLTASGGSSYIFLNGASAAASNELSIQNNISGGGIGFLLLGSTVVTIAPITGHLLLNTTTDNGTDTLQVNGSISATMVKSPIYGGRGVNAMITLSSLSTAYPLGIGGVTGLLIIRDNSAGGSAVYMIDGVTGVVQIASNLSITVSIVWNGGTDFTITQTAGATGHEISYVVYGSY